MKLRRRRKRKPEQALDALASVTKIWSEWQLGKKASKGVAKAKGLRPPGKIKRILSLKWVKVGGAVAVAGGTAAAVGRKLKGDDDPASYSGPAPSVAADAAVPAADTPPPLTVAPDPATQERDTESVGGASTLRDNRDSATETEPAASDPETPEAAFPPGPTVDATDDDATGDDAEATADAEEPAADAETK